MHNFDPRRMLAFDLETTGTDPRTCKIVTSALVRLTEQGKDSTIMLADPGVEIPQAASDVHGITTEKARAEGRPHDEVLADTIAGLKAAWRDGLTVVAYNAAYDLTVLRSQDPNFTVDGLVVDPFVLDNYFDPDRREKRTLTDVSRHYQVRLDGAHDATEDALAAARIAWVMARHYRELTEKSGEELMELQAVAYYQYKKNLQLYLADKGRDVSDFTFGWPTDVTDA
ncbi:3'-5' exonuclease [Corynebacterium amycolatum]|uniref:3'-5' exonuclease n=1 Tax=Corynebacterium amycolatum TaxID=43765 RepID=UPI000185C155|nr:3'-5' exonuclease [Corynebacterium amycolatum]EEB64042.1 exonuclease [Corynebacterium amycolatum SK46]